MSIYLSYMILHAYNVYEGLCLHCWARIHEHLRYRNFNSVLQTVHEQFSALDAASSIDTAEFEWGSIGGDLHNAGRYCVVGLWPQLNRRIYIYMYIVIRMIIIAKKTCEYRIIEKACGKVGSGQMRSGAISPASRRTSREPPGWS